MAPLTQDTDRPGRPTFFLMNSAVLTGEGRYDYRYVSPERARQWLGEVGDRAAHFQTAVGYESVARACEALLGYKPPVQRQVVKMQPGDEALILRLRMRVTPGLEEKITPAFARQHVELGLLTRVA